jgi:phage gpG-like protein
MPNGFQIRWTIEGVPELSRILLDTYQKVNNLKKPLQASAKLIRQDVEQQFKTEGGLTGGWEPLAKSTLKGRGSSPILQVSGALRRSFYSLVDEKRAIISSKSPYFKYHQSRMPRMTKLPRRAMLILTERTRQNIVQEFKQFLRFK